MTLGNSLSSLYAKLRAIIDGDAVTLTPDDAKALHATLVARGLRISVLERECNELVAQIVSEDELARMLGEIERLKATCPASTTPQP